MSQVQKNGKSAKLGGKVWWLHVGKDHRACQRQLRWMKQIEVARTTYPGHAATARRASLLLAKLEGSGSLQASVAVALLFFLGSFLPAWAIDCYWMEKWKILQSCGIAQARPEQVAEVQDPDVVKNVLEASTRVRQLVEDFIGWYHQDRALEDLAFRVFSRTWHLHYGEESWSEVSKNSEDIFILRFENVRWGKSSVQYTATGYFGDSHRGTRFRFWDHGFKETISQNGLVVELTASWNEEIIRLKRKAWLNIDESLPAGSKIEETLLVDKDEDRKLYVSHFSSPQGHLTTVFVNDDDDEFYGAAKEEADFWVFYNYKDEKVRRMQNHAGSSPPSSVEPPTEETPKLPSEGEIKQWLAMASSVELALREVKR
jgi:hypothetical protein